MSTALVTGATGYLGRFVVHELTRCGYTVRAAVRNRSRACRPGAWGSPSLAGVVDEWAVGDISDPAFSAEIASGVDVVVSALGVTRQKADPWQIDYRANLATLTSAERHGVRAFCFVNGIGSDRCLAELTKAKTAFAQSLVESSLVGQIINPTGYFSDMMQVFTMARRGRVFLLDPQRKTNPIHGADLAAACIDRLESEKPGTWNVGGPDVFTWQQLAEQACTALGKQPRVTRIPPAVLPPVQWLAAAISSRSADILRFVTWAMLHDTVGEPTGTHHLGDLFAEYAAN